MIINSDAAYISLTALSLCNYLGVLSNYPHEQSDFLVFELRLKLFVVPNLAGCFHEVLFDAIVSVLADGEHSRLSADISQVSTIEFFANLGNGLEVEVSSDGNRFRMNFQDLLPGGFIGKRDFNLAIESSRSKKGGIEDVWSIGGHYNFDTAELIESVKLIEKFHQSSLDFSVCGVTLAEPPSSDSVDFVHEDNAGFVISSVSEHLSNDSC